MTRHADSFLAYKNCFMTGKLMAYKASFAEYNSFQSFWISFCTVNFYYLSYLFISDTLNVTGFMHFPWLTPGKLQIT